MFKVYPRVCGGTNGQLTGYADTLASGLSPRVRGNLRNGGIEGRLVAAGSIPRVCGGTYVMGALRPAARGLSPRVRGNQLLYFTFA